MRSWEVWRLIRTQAVLAGLNVYCKIHPSKRTLQKCVFLCVPFVNCHHFTGIYENILYESRLLGSFYKTHCYAFLYNLWSALSCQCIAWYYHRIGLLFFNNYSKDGISKSVNASTMSILQVLIFLNLILQNDIQYYRTPLYSV